MPFTNKVSSNNSEAVSLTGNELNLFFTEAFRAAPKTGHNIDPHYHETLMKVWEQAKSNREITQQTIKEAVETLKSSFLSLNAQKMEAIENYLLMKFKDIATNDVSKRPALLPKKTGFASKIKKTSPAKGNSNEL